MENRLLEAAGVSLRVHLMDKQWVKARSRIWAVPQPMKFVVKCVPREEQEERKEWKAVPCSLGAETLAGKAVFQFDGTVESNHMWCLRQGYSQFLVLPEPDMYGGRVKLGDRILVAVRDMTSGAPSQVGLWI